MDCISLGDCQCRADQSRKVVELTTLKSAIESESQRHKVPQDIVEAIIFQESVACSDEPRYAIRFEEGFYEKNLRDRGIKFMSGFLPSANHAMHMPSLFDEKVLRACSYGYMQILGETARVIGFKGQYLTELLDTESNIYWGCYYLSKCMRAFRSLPEHDQVFQALTRYNGSSTYPPKVLGHIANSNHLKIYQ
jgi:hypothetical protein